MIAPAAPALPPAVQAKFEWDGDAADDQRPPFHQHMQVIALPDPERDVGREVDALGGMACLGGRGGMGSAGIRGVRIGSHRT